MGARNHRAEIEFGRRITELRAEETRKQREALARKRQEEADAEEARRQEILSYGSQFASPVKPADDQPANEAPPAPSLPPPAEVDLPGAKRAKKLPSG